ncbi:hypothetical protein FCV25MIE_14362 [Fagus crenata]
MSKKLEVYRGSRRDSYLSDVEELAKNQTKVSNDRFLAKIATTTPIGFDQALRDLDRMPPAFNHALGFEQAPPCVYLAQLGLVRAPPRFDLVPPPTGESKFYQIAAKEEEEGKQLILEHCIEGDFGIDKILGLLQRTYHWHGLKQVHQSVQQRLQEVNAKYKARLDQYVHGDVSIA